jgi:hypothetical protein
LLDGWNAGMLECWNAGTKKEPLREKKTCGFAFIVASTP